MIFTGKTSGTGEILVQKNTNGIIDGITKDIKGKYINIRVALTKNETSIFMVSEQGHQSRAVSELASMEVRPAANS